MHATPRPVLLDYGCGDGELINLANDSGMDAYGVEAFYGGGDTTKKVVQKGLLGTRVLPLNDGAIPFPDARFDVVISNQVFEHIDDFNTPLCEIYRVLKPGGLFINLFPTSEVWREGHIGIPFVHWFPKRSKVRFLYALINRSLGIAYHKRVRAGKSWTKNYLAWIDKWTYYKPLSDVNKAFERYFFIEHYGADYLLFRLERHPYLNIFMYPVRLTIFRPFLQFLCGRLSGWVFVMTKK